MKKQDRNAALDESRITDLEHRVGELTSELAGQRRRADAGTLLDSLTSALVGELDPERIVETVERWVADSLQRPCTVTQLTPSEADPGLDDAPPSLWLPLDSDDGPMGWLCVGGPELDSTDRAVVEEVANRAGRALAAATAVAGRSHAFRTLERSLLPDALLPLPGLQLASRYLPATGSHDVGGDFYDAVRIDNRITLIVGDVQGKGVEAATLTSLARHTLRAGALAGHEPAALLAQLNTALLYGQAEQLHAGQIRCSDSSPRWWPASTRPPTASVCEWPAPASHRRSSCAAPARSSTSSRRAFSSACVRTRSSRKRSVELAIGDTLILYTDGVIEQRDASRSFSERHLGMLVRNRRNVVDAEATASSSRTPSTSSPPSGFATTSPSSSRAWCLKRTSRAATKRRAGAGGGVSAAGGGAVPRR